MLLSTTVRNPREKGQAIMLVLVALSLFLIAGLGLAIDGSNLYAHRQMLQAGADSAAQAGIMSIFNASNTGTNAFGSASFTCTTTDVRTPCYYGRQNGVGSTTADTVVVDFPTSAPGVSLSAADTPNLIQVTITRSVSTGLIRMVAPSAATVKAAATAAIVDVVAPVPILVLHPTLSNSFSTNGGPQVQICGGPTRSVQVNSSSTTAVSLDNNATVDLSKAGPADPGDCSTGTGADFGTFGGPAAKPGGISLGTTGKYIQPSSPILDPLASVAAPTVPAAAPAKAALGNGVCGCPASPGKACNLYYPGLYATGINVKNETAVFTPGLYYMQSSGFQSAANGDIYMATVGCNPGSGVIAADPSTGSGIVVYITGNNAGDTVNVGANGSVTLVGSPAASVYKGMLFFGDRGTTVQKSHSLGGGGALSLIGTIYLTNRLSDMTTTPGVYQAVSFSGHAGSSTHIIGEIIVDTLSLGGNSGITMTLNPNAVLHIRQVALVK